MYRWIESWLIDWNMRRCDIDEFGQEMSRWEKVKYLAAILWEHRKYA